MAKLYTRFDNIFFEKTRLSIMTLLVQNEVLSFNWLKDSLDQSDGALYSHLEKLYKEGYIDKRKELAGPGAQTVYALTEKGKQQYTEYIDFLEVLIRGSK